MDPKQVRRMTRARNCTCAVCFYCETPLADRHEHDHFPVPKIAGGREVVAACLDCHDLKDRVKFERWPVDAAALAGRGLVETLFPADAAADSHGDMIDWLADRSAFTDAEIVRRWDELPALSRILYGKLRSIEEERAHRRATSTPVHRRCCPH